MAVVTKVHFRHLDKLRFELNYNLTEKFQNIIGTKIAQEKCPHRCFGNRLCYAKNSSTNTSSYLESLFDLQNLELHLLQLLDNAHLVFYMSSGLV